MGDTERKRERDRKRKRKGGGDRDIQTRHHRQKKGQKMTEIQRDFKNGIKEREREKERKK